MPYLFLLLFSTLLLAEDISDELYNKVPLTTSQMDNKEENSYFTGLPILSYDSDTGFGYGARVYWHDNGKKSDPLFDYTPYKYEIYGQFLQSTNGWSYHVLHFDAPYIGETLFRLTGEFLYEANTQANYFGTTANSMDNLYDTHDKTYTTAQEQQKALDDQGSRYFNRYDLKRPIAEIDLARDFFGGLVRLSGGVIISHASVDTYENQTVNDIDNNQSLLFENNRVNPLVGYNGGFDNGVKIGFVYDSRDFAPNPKNGNMFDFTAGFYGKFLGGDYEHQRYTFSTRNFYTSDSFKDLTLAFRWVYSIQQGDTPFYAKNALGFADEFKYGLGGFRTLRGYQQDRFVADVKTVINFEPRFHFYTSQIWGQHFSFQAVPFLDAGKVFDTVSDTDLKDYRYSYGVGLRTAWNQSTIIMIDYGQSVEDSGLYINFGHIF